MVSVMAVLASSTITIHMYSLFHKPVPRWIQKLVQCSEGFIISKLNFLKKDIEFVGDSFFSFSMCTFGIQIQYTYSQYYFHSYLFSLQKGKFQAMPT